MITLQQWKDCEGQAFTLVNGDSLTLAEVTMPISPEGWECFSLLFAGQLQLEQGETVLKNDALGETAVFLVPVGPLGASDGTYHFEAVFNRQVASA
ncbi:MAG: hypothetical protein V7688_15960 [Alcanivorax jadensis]|jgi:hypothetical protein|uniref:DUF6916 family protein n=1 Tax=Alcanivorax jadensis TaxID=64988 RepID=UPI003001F2E9|tara:strand:+ start:502 stop:789 length:288 start_codon:yes stop_codon:yes gene_type:complete